MASGVRGDIVAVVVVVGSRLRGSIRAGGGGWCVDGDSGGGNCCADGGVGIGDGDGEGEGEGGSGIDSGWKVEMRC